jgi:hypothetical protein
MPRAVKNADVPSPNQEIFRHPLHTLKDFNSSVLYIISVRKEKIMFTERYCFRRVVGDVKEKVKTGADTKWYVQFSHNLVISSC